MDESKDTQPPKSPRAKVGCNIPNTTPRVAKGHYGNWPIMAVSLELGQVRQETTSAITVRLFSFGKIAARAICCVEADLREIPSAPRLARLDPGLAW